MFALAAAVCFILATFGVDFDAINLVALGLFFLALGVFFGPWPIVDRWSRR